MIANSELRRLQSELSCTNDALGNIEFIPGLGSPSLVARTKAISSYPTVAASFFGCEPLTILGPETEGSTGVVTASGATFLAYNLGSAIPPALTSIIASFVNHRWVFRYDG